MKLSVFLENCYGIGKLEYNFDFSEEDRTFVIYASNGIMKTSFANTFWQLQKGTELSKDLYGNEPKCEIQIGEEDIEKEEIFVIKSYVEEYNSEVASLLIDKTSKEQYEKILSEISKDKNLVLESLKEKSGFKKVEEVEQQLLKDFSFEEKNLFELLDFLSKKQEHHSYEDIKYDTLFNEKASAFLKDKDTQKNISDFMEKYNAILEQHPFFKKGAFNPIRATDLCNAFEKTGFFEAENTINLKGEQEPLKKEDLKKKIEEVNKAIKEDKTLASIQKKLSKNNNAKELQSLLEEKIEIIPELSNPNLLKQKLWYSYLALHKETIKNMLSEYEKKSDELKKIENKAKEQKTDWDNALSTFQNRFDVPFKLEIDNKKSAILGLEIPKVICKYGKHTADREKLEKEILSTGEKKALYLLNIVFEVERRKKANKETSQKTLFIIDDVADSFDYANKYAIIEYLKDFHENQNDFYQIILTHNFDFYRTIVSRFRLKREKCCLLAKRDKKREVSFEIAGNEGILDPLKNWKSCKDILQIITCIPFAREIVRHQNNDDDKSTLNNLLHWKKEIKNVKFEQLEKILSKILGIKNFSENIDIQTSVYDQMLKEADKIDKDSNKLEHKVVLAIVTRLKAEEYMIGEMNLEPDKIPSKFGQLFEKFKKYCEDQSLPKISEKNF